MSEDALAREVSEVTRSWWLVAVMGVLSVVAGIVVLAKPGDSLATLAVIAGIFILVDGLAELVAALATRTEGRGLVAVLGVLSVVVGLLLIRHPIHGVTAVALLLGLWLVAAGVVRLIGAFEEPEHRGRRIASAPGPRRRRRRHRGQPAHRLRDARARGGPGLHRLRPEPARPRLEPARRAGAGPAGRSDPRAELSPRRRRAAAALAVLAGVLLALAGLLAYVHSEVADERAFAGRLVAALDDPAVRAVVADRSVDALVARGAADVLAVRPLATAAVGALVGTPAFGRVAARAAADVHRQVAGGRPEVVLRLDRAAPVLQDALRGVSPRLAARTDAGARPVIATLGRGDGLTALRRVLDVSAWWWAVLLGAAAAAAAAVRVGRDARRTLGALGLALAAAGAAVAALEVGARSTVAARAAPAPGRPPTADADAVAATWTALFGDLRTAALVGDRRRPGRRRSWPGRCPGPGPRRRPPSAGAGARTAGAGTAGTPAPGGPRRRRGARGARRGAHGRRAARRRRPVGAAGDRRRAPGRCDGSVALCGRRLDDVVFAGTHNSYAAADEPGWLFANQRHGIARQLDAGIRALLLDVHAGVRDPATGRVGPTSAPRA